MRQTEHYQLSQWDAEDRILRENFNNDNANVDAALAGLRSDMDKKVDLPTVRGEIPWVKIGEATLNAAAQKVAVNIPNPEKYALFFIRFDVSGGTQISTSWTGGSEKLLAYETWNPVLRCAGMGLAAVMPKGGVAVSFSGGYLTEEEHKNMYAYDLLDSAASSGTIQVGLTAGNGKLLNAGSFLEVYGVKK